MTDFTESMAFLSIVKIFICRYSPWQIRIFAIHPRFPSPLLILLLCLVNINECRVLKVSLVVRFKFKTDLIINWIYLIKTHSRETLGKSSIYISKVLNCKNFLKMLVIIGPHSLNTSQARVIDMKLYCDDVMGGSDDPPGSEPLFPILLNFLFVLR